MILNPIVNNENGKMDIFSLNLENRIVLLTGEINDEMATSVISQLLYLDSCGDETINLYINSPGGCVNSGLAIYDTIKSLKCPVATICVGRAASMGAILLSAGSIGKRVVLPHSEVMIHQPSGGVDGQARDILIAASHIEKLRDELTQILSINCNKSIELIKEATDWDYWMNAQEAVDFGIADRMYK